jgi:hypothetical protein
MIMNVHGVIKKKSVNGHEVSENASDKERIEANKARVSKEAGKHRDQERKTPTARIVRTVL